MAHCMQPRRCASLTKNLTPAKKSEVAACLRSKLQGTLQYSEGKDWAGHGNFPSSIKPGCIAHFSSEQPCKAGAVYIGKNQNGVECGWLIAFTALGGNNELKVYAETGKKEKYESVNWKEILEKLNEADADSYYADPRTGCVANAEISNCPRTGGARLAVSFADGA